MIECSKFINDDEQADDLQLNGYYIIQKKKGFRFGLDAVLLSDFAESKKDDTVVDLGAGSGIISILLAAKTQAGKITAVEIQESLCDMAKRSILMNKLERKIDVANIDLKDAPKKLGRNIFDLAVSNPPYKKNGTGLLNTDDTKTISRHEILCTINDVIYNAAQLLKQQGRLVLVHRPDRLADIIYAMREHKIEPKKMRMVYPNKNKRPNLVLISGTKCGNPELKHMPPLFVYNEDNEYTDDINRIYGRSSK